MIGNFCGYFLRVSYCTPTMCILPNAEYTSSFTYGMLYFGSFILKILEVLRSFANACPRDPAHKRNENICKHSQSWLSFLLIMVFSETFRKIIHNKNTAVGDRARFANCCYKSEQSLWESSFNPHLPYFTLNKNWNFLQFNLQQLWMFTSQPKRLADVFMFHFLSSP